jgi:hypothetical protein
MNLLATSQLAALLHSIAQPPPLGRVILDASLIPEFICRDEYFPLEPVLKVNVPDTVAEPLPTALQVTVHEPAAAVGLALKGL